MKKVDFVTHVCRRPSSPSFMAHFAANAQTVTWDPSGSVTPTDGSGNWDTTSSQWYDPGTTRL